MKPLLIILPSRGRPEKIKLCIDSYLSTTDGTYSELQVQLDNCDPKVDEYRKVLNQYDSERVSYKIRPRPSNNPKVYCLTRIINRAFYCDKSREYYSVINDDMIFESKDWDKILALPWCISTCKERNMIEKYGETMNGSPVAGFPIISVIDGRICREIGWLQMPEIEGGCGDNCWFILGLQCKNLIYNPNVVFVHNHFAFNKSEMDDTYAPIYGNENSGAMDDYKRFLDWAKYRATRVIKQIKVLLQENLVGKPQEAIVVNL